MPLRIHPTGMLMLITGGCGFVGSSLALAFRREYPTAEVVAFDNLRRRGAELNVPRLARHGVRFVHGDVRLRADLDDLPGRFEVLVEASAEPWLSHGDYHRTGQPAFRSLVTPDDA